jgi:hypothetical protein
MRRVSSGWILFGWTIGVLTLAQMGCSDDAPVASSSSQEASASQPATQNGLLRDIQNWGPKMTKAGTSFNPLPNGDSAFWILGTGERQVVVELANRPLPTVVADNAVTATVSKELVQTLLAQPGTYELALASPASGRRQRVGEFRVE